MSNADWSAAIQAIRTILCADCACSERDLLDEGIVVTLAREVPGRRRFPLGPKPLLIATMGQGVVVSCGADRMNWFRGSLGQSDRETVFSPATIAHLAIALQTDGQALVGPHLKWLCARDTFRPVPPPDGVDLGVAEGDAVSQLYRHRGFPHALAYRQHGPRPDVLAVVASRAGTLLGIAAASADHVSLWQVGVEVVPSARGEGIGRALVSRLTETILHLGHLPYYSTTVSHLHSQGLAVSLGYRPAWTELYVVDAQESLSAAVRRATGHVPRSPSR